MGDLRYSKILLLRTTLVKWIGGHSDTTGIHLPNGTYSMVHDNNKCFPWGSNPYNLTRRAMQMLKSNIQSTRRPKNIEHRVLSGKRENNIISLSINVWYNQIFIIMGTLLGTVQVVSHNKWLSTGDVSMLFTVNRGDRIPFHLLIGHALSLHWTWFNRYRNPVFVYHWNKS